MATYRFIKVYSMWEACDIEAETYEEACELVESRYSDEYYELEPLECENRFARLINEDGDVEEEYEW